MSRNPSDSAPIRVSSHVIKGMQDLADAYSSFNPMPSISAVAPVTSPGHVIFLSGTTGSLGSCLLDRLLRNDAVAKVYAFNRRGPTSASAMERHNEAFVERGLDPSVLQKYGHKYELLEGDLAKENFGLGKEQFLEIASSVTIIVHNAWPVSFKMALKSFTPVVQGLRNLLSFAIASPHKPPLLFSSSIAKLQNAPTSDTPHKEAPVPAEWSVKTGYSKSKWVAEQLLARATQSSGLRTLSVRIGQLCGGDNGSWRAEEWFPSVILTGASLGMIPTSDGVVNWMVLSTAAKVYADFIFASRSISGHQIVHLWHPRPVLWRDIASDIAEELNLPMASFEQWFKALHTLIDPNSSSKSDLEKLARAFPLIKILPFIETTMVYADNSAPLVDSLGVPVLDMSNALRLSPTLRDPGIPRLDKTVVQSWLRYLGLSPAFTVTSGRKGWHLSRL